MTGAPPPPPDPAAVPTGTLPAGRGWPPTFLHFTSTWPLGVSAWKRTELILFPYESIWSFFFFNSKVIYEASVTPNRCRALPQADGVSAWRWPLPSWCHVQSRLPCPNPPHISSHCPWALGDAQVFLVTGSCHPAAAAGSEQDCPPPLLPAQAHGPQRPPRPPALEASPLPYTRGHTQCLEPSTCPVWPGHRGCAVTAQHFHGRTPPTQAPGVRSALSLRPLHRTP